MIENLKAPKGPKLKAVVLEFDDGRVFEVPTGMLLELTVDSMPFYRTITMKFNVPENVIVSAPYENREQAKPEVPLLADPQD